MCSLHYKQFVNEFNYFKVFSQYFSFSKQVNMCNIAINNMCNSNKHSPQHKQLAVFISVIKSVFVKVKKHILPGHHKL